DRINTTETTSVTFNTGNLTPGASGDYFRIMSSNASTSTAVSVTAPAAGATTASMTFTWPKTNQFVFNGLPRNDLTYILQGNTTPSAAGTPSARRSTILSYNSGNLTVPDGGGTITAALQPAPQASVPANVKMSQFVAMNSLVNPGAVPDSAILDLRALAHSAT